jgi:hypothetical protein
MITFAHPIKITRDKIKRFIEKKILIKGPLKMAVFRENSALNE